MPVTELSEKLTALGRPIPPLGLRRIEDGSRRVDVDDLTSIALALDVSPISLLMPHTESEDDPAEVSGHDEPVRAGVLWGWLRTSGALRDPAGASESTRRAMVVDWVSWARRATPPWHDLGIVPSDGGAWLVPGAMMGGDRGDD